MIMKGVSKGSTQVNVSDLLLFDYQYLLGQKRIEMRLVDVVPVVSVVLAQWHTRIWNVLVSKLFENLENPKWNHLAPIASRNRELLSCVYSYQNPDSFPFANAARRRKRWNL